MQMSVAGLDLDKLHIVGHSLGAQMAGLIGRIIKQSMHGKLVIKRYLDLVRRIRVLDIIHFFTVSPSSLGYLQIL